MKNCIENNINDAYKGFGCVFFIVSILNLFKREGAAKRFLPPHLNCTYKRNYKLAKCKYYTVCRHCVVPYRITNLFTSRQHFNAV